MTARRAFRALLLSITAERFGFYGFLAIFVLDQIRQGAPQKVAAAAVGNVLAAVYAATFLGGLLGQRLGFRNVALAGLTLCAAAYLEIVAGLSAWAWGPLLAVGIGLFKPAIPILVNLVDSSPRAMPRFYAAVNVGGCFGPLLHGYLAARGLFGVAFGISAACCVASQAALLWGGASLSKAAETEIVVGRALSVDYAPEDTNSLRDRVVGIWLLCAFAVVFWSGYHAFFGSVEHLIETEVDRHVLNFEVPSAWFNAENGAIILVCGILFPAWMSTWRFSNRILASLLCSAVSFGLIVWATRTHHLVALVPAVAVLVETVGELFISPLGLSSVTSLAPAHRVGVYTALWYLSSSIGGWLSGQLSHSAMVLLSAVGAALVLVAAKRLEAAMVSARPAHDPKNVTLTSRSTSKTLALSPGCTAIESCSDV